MDFDIQYTAEQRSFRAEVAAWLEVNVPANVRGREGEEEESEEVYQRRRELGRKLGERGWLYPMAPVDYGGGGLTIDSAMVIMEALEQYELNLPPYYDSGGALGSVAILVWGTDEQKRAFLPPIYSGAQRTWQLLTEPNAGSDLASVSTQAVRDGDEYVINGQKVFIGSAHGTDAMWTLVRTGAEGDRHQNLSWFMIDAHSAGISMDPLNLLGNHAKQTIFLDNVRVPAFNLIGGENLGWEVATTHLDLEHGLRTDNLIGSALSSRWEALRQYAEANREVLQSRVSDDRVRDLLAQAYINKEVVGLLSKRNFWSTMTDRPLTYEGSQAYLIDKQAMLWFSQALLEILGPFALFEDGGAQSAALVDVHSLAISNLHGGGTREVQKMVMARRIGLGGDKEAAGKLSPSSAAAGST